MLYVARTFLFYHEGISDKPAGYFQSAKVRKLIEILKSEMDYKRMQKWLSLRLSAVNSLNISVKKRQINL